MTDTMHRKRKSRPDAGPDHNILPEIRETIELIQDLWTSASAELEQWEIGALLTDVLACYGGLLACAAGAHSAGHDAIEKIRANAAELVEELAGRLPHGLATLFYPESELFGQMEDLETSLAGIRGIAGRYALYPESAADASEYDDLCTDVIRGVRSMYWLARFPHPQLTTLEGYYPWRQRFTDLETDFAESCYAFREYEAHHPGCLAGVLPAIDRQDDGQVIQRLYEAAGQSAEGAATPCPDEATLTRYALTELADAGQVLDLEAHILECGTCLKKTIELRHKASIAGQPQEQEIGEIFAREQQTARYIDLSGHDLPPSSPVVGVAQHMPAPLYAGEQPPTSIPVHLVLLWRRQSGLLGASRLEPDIHYFSSEEGFITLSGGCREDDLRLIPAKASVTCVLVLSNGEEIRPSRQHPAATDDFHGSFSCSFPEPSGEIDKILVSITIDVAGSGTS